MGTKVRRSRGSRKCKVCKVCKPCKRCKLCKKCKSLRKSLKKRGGAKTRAPNRGPKKGMRIEKSLNAAVKKARAAEKAIAAAQKKIATLQKRGKPDHKDKFLPQIVGKQKQIDKLTEMKNPDSEAYGILKAKEKGMKEKVLSRKPMPMEFAPFGSEGSANLVTIANTPIRKRSKDEMLRVEVVAKGLEKVVVGGGTVAKAKERTTGTRSLI